ncbi:MAG: phosphate transport regulator [Chloroflexi bacterium RBG_13_48_17]|nr:MAG: phosphate transport regulator [Chloroflexi bacterium RBG_13_48_17]
MPRFSLFPREEKFFVLFEQSAQNAVKIAQQLRDLVNTWENIKERVEMITSLEHDGDAITHQIIAQLHRTFVTPLDREDIALLAETLDDITDLIHSAADAMLLYKVERPTDKVKELADIVVQAAIEVEKGVSEIHNRIDRDKLLKRCMEINRLENVGDSVYRSALAELFVNSPDFAYLMKWREIYENVESAIDKCEDIANVLEGIALKYA